MLRAYLFRLLFSSTSSSSHSYVLYIDSMNNESLLVNYVALQSTNLSSLKRNRIVENNVLREIRLIKASLAWLMAFSNLYSLNFFLYSSFVMWKHQFRVIIKVEAIPLKKIQKQLNNTIFRIKPTKQQCGGTSRIQASLLHDLLCICVISSLIETLPHKCTSVLASRFRHHISYT